MFRAVRAWFGGARRAAAALDAPPRIARWTFVGVAVAIVGFGIVVGTRVTAVSDGLGDRVSWFGVVSVAACAFAAGMSGSRGLRYRSSGLLALAVGFGMVYVLAVLVTYEPPKEPWLWVSRVLWPSVPVAIAFWARAAFTVSGEVRRTRTGVSQFWLWMHGVCRWSSRLKVHPLSIRMPLTELLGVWLPCLVFSVASFVPGFMFDEQVRVGEPWMGWVVSPRWPYTLFALWGFGVLVVAAVTVEAAWQSRRKGVFAGVLVRARGARVATKWSIVAFATLAVNVWGGWWPEPLLDVPVAGLFLFYVLRSADADAHRNAAEAFSSIRRRWMWAAGWVSASVLFAAGLGRGPFMTGVYAAMIAVIYPLAPTGLRAKDGIPQELAEGPRRPSRLTAGRAEDIAALLTGGEHSPIEIGAVSRTREALQWITDAEIRLLLGGLPTHEGRMPPSERDPRMNVRLRRFVGQWPALDARGDFDARLERFQRLFYDTVTVEPVVSLALAKPERFNPTNQWIVQAYLLQQISVAEGPTGEENEACIRNRYRLWLRRQHNGSPGDGRPVYLWFGGRDPARQIVEMSCSELIDSLVAITGRKNHEGSKARRDRALNSAAKLVRRRWIELLVAYEAVLHGQGEFPSTW